MNQKILEKYNYELKNSQIYINLQLQSMRRKNIEIYLRRKMSKPTNKKSIQNNWMRTLILRKQETTMIWNFIE